MNHFSDFYSIIKNTELEKVFLPAKEKIEYKYSSENHGDVSKWVEILNLFPEINPSEIDLDQGRIVIGNKSDCDDLQRSTLSELLMEFHPWRKGPFSLFDINIDTEWRCDWKWGRLKNEIAPLKDKTVLDAGCGNGYYCLRMIGAGAKRVIGVDPTLIYVAQFKVLNQFIKTDSVHVLPLLLEDLPENQPLFDTVFSMGVLYHHRSPLDHLARLHGYIRKGGELVLETLIVDGDTQEILEPNGRYAKMRNVWQIPTVKTLEYWLENSCFEDIRLIDISVTTTEEQQRTQWMRFESLENFLDCKDKSRTIEGWPAPKRAIMVARKA